MNSKFEPHQQSMFSNSPEPMNTQGQSSVNAFHGDRFELLSAYIDGEVTAAEQKQVEEWLATDPTVQQLHNRLMKLRSAFRTMPSPAPVQPVEKTVEQVMAKLDRPRPNLRLVWGGGAAIAAAVLGAVSMFALRPSEQFANGPKQPASVSAPAPTQTAENPDADGLLVALDQPLPGMTPQNAVQKTPAKTNHDTH